MRSDAEGEGCINGKFLVKGVIGRSKEQNEVSEFWICC